MEGQVASTILEGGVLAGLVLLFVFLFVRQVSHQQKMLRELLEAMNKSSQAMEALKDIVKESLRRGHDNGRS